MLLHLFYVVTNARCRCISISDHSINNDFHNKCGSISCGLADISNEIVPFVAVLEYAK